MFLESLKDTVGFPPLILQVFTVLVLSKLEYCISQLRTHGLLSFMDRI